MSTPQSYFHTLSVSREHPHTMGLSITASHNPAAYVGLKFTVPTVRAIGLDCGPLGGLTRVRELYHSQERPSAAPGGRLIFHDLRREYLEFSMAAAGVGPGQLEGLSVVLDGFHGAAGPELHAALGRAGVAVTGRRLIPDGRFPTGSPNPTSQGKMDAAVALARELRRTAVIGVDGDGDRIVFGDGRGILAAGFVAVPVLKACGLSLRDAPQPVLYDPKVNPLALAEWHRLNARPVLFRNGHSQIKEYMRRIGAVAAAEESGHYYHELSLGGLTISAENSVLTVLLFLGALRENPGLMDELWSLQERVFTTGEFNYAFADDSTRDRALAAAVDACVCAGARPNTTTSDGIDLQGTVLARSIDPGTGHLEPDWYSGYLRVSTNEKAVVRSYFSAGDPEVGRVVETRVRELFAGPFQGKVVD